MDEDNYEAKEIVKALLELLKSPDEDLAWKFLSNLNNYLDSVRDKEARKREEGRDQDYWESKGLP